MSKEVCELIIGVDKLLDVKWVGSTLSISDNSTLNNFCPLLDNGTQQKCNSYEESVSSAFISLLTLFNNDNDYQDDLKSGKLTKYAILWLCYKLNYQTKNQINNLNDFHNKYIKDIENYIVKRPNIEAYNSYKDIIDKKQNSVPIGIKEMSKLYEALKILCNMQNKYEKSTSNCTKCLEEANNFAVKYNDLNSDSNHIEGSLYSKMLSTLSNDYDDFKNKCGNGQSKKFPSLSQITPQKSSADTYGQIAIQYSDVETSSSSIASKLIPGLLTFAIPIFLGVAYKYSLFGFDKRLHGQYLRGKIKK
ncbi:CIR protein, partial [Plasmodium chabaudi chabaudi]